jgi:hypothetical protein
MAMANNSRVRVISVIYDLLPITDVRLTDIAPRACSCFA